MKIEMETWRHPNFLLRLTDLYIYQDFNRLFLLGLAQPKKNAVYFIFCDGHGYDVDGDLAHFLFHVFLHWILSVCIFYARHFRHRCHFDAFYVFCHHYNFGQLEILVANHAFKRRKKWSHLFYKQLPNKKITPLI